MSTVQDEEETLKAAQKILDPYIRPREEVAHIRRILALHLDSCLKDGSATSPLALVEASEQNGSTATRGLYAKYLEALAQNMKARSEYKACAGDSRQARGEDTRTTVPAQDHILDHLASISLQRKKERLQVVEQHLDALGQKPAASPNFLDPNGMFQYSHPLPEVPQEVVSSLALYDKTRPDTHLKDLIDQLEKHVLRTKLLLKREEQLLEQVKLRSSANPKTTSESAKFEALDATRNELINWIETELGNASGDGRPEDEERRQQYGSGGQDLGATAKDMDQKLASIREKYSRYTAARKNLLLLISHQPKPNIKPPSQNSEMQSTTASDANPPVSAHLFSPYLSQLLSIAREQKGLIAEKSHINTSIARQLKDNSQALNRLAEESQLIPAHLMPGVARRKPSGGGFSEGSARVGGSSSDALDTSSHVKPWVFAADSAKIATLEAVAEKIDEGQMALEGSMRTIGEIEQLLGLHHPDGGKQAQQPERSGENAPAAEDMWLVESEGTPSRRLTGGGHRRHVENEKKAKKGADGDVWTVLDGNLGLLGGENDPP